MATPTLPWSGPDNRTFGGKSADQLTYPETQKYLKDLMSEHETRIQAYAQRYGVSRDKASKVIGGWDNNTLSDIKKLQQQASTTYPLYMQEQYQRQMAEYMGMMAEAMNREEPASEPLKAAAEVQSAARADTNRKQLLRRGLMSTLTRYGQGGQAQKLGA